VSDDDDQMMMLIIAHIAMCSKIMKYSAKRTILAWRGGCVRTHRTPLATGLADVLARSVLGML